MSAAVESHGASAHGPDCGCPRCVGFQPGHDLSVRHGAYVSPARLAPRANEIASALAEIVPVSSPSDSPAIAAAAVVLTRIERASKALEETDGRNDSEAHEVLERSLRLWLAELRSWCDRLGLSPLGRAELGLAVASAQSIQVRTELDLSKLTEQQLQTLAEMVEAAGEVVEEADGAAG